MYRKQDVELQQVAVQHRRQIDLVLALLPVEEVHQLLGQLAIGLDGLGRPQASEVEPPVNGDKILEEPCRACNGKGVCPVVRPAAPGRRIYPPRCTKCDGKGRTALKLAK